MTLFLELLAVAALLLLNAFFVAGEYALVTARRTRLRELEEAGNRRARTALAITSDPPRFIAAMQLGVTATSLAIGAVGEPVLARVFDPVVATVAAVLIAFLLITYLHVVVGELVPKGVALGHSESVALAVSGPVRLFFWVFKPLIWVLQSSSDVFLRVLGLEPPGAEGAVHSEAELKMLLSRSAEHGELQEDEQEMLYKVFDFADKEVADVMVPRPEVVALSVDLPPEECLAAVIDSPYTRYPVYRESLENIVGILHVRALFSAMANGGFQNILVEQLIRPAPMVPETKDLAAMLKEFRRTNQHMAIVVDEYGAMEGIVTLEDLLEEIVGEIEDEFDLPDETVERIDDKRIRVHGTFPIDDFNEQFGRDMPQEDFHTLAGFVFGQLGRGPERGDDVVWDGLRFTVIELEGARIERLEVEFLEDEPESAEPAAAESA
ncbi:MAG TPA: hemolysin family protein [Gaiellaceae bacterium]|nr:hemolysin family protein [Gaiellaceae bacterium]